MWEYKEDFTYSAAFWTSSSMNVGSSVMVPLNLLLPNSVIIVSIGLTFCWTKKNWKFKCKFKIERYFYKKELYLLFLNEHQPKFCKCNSSVWVIVTLSKV